MSFRLFLTFALIAIYITGCAHFRKEVKNACTHGNCTHGFYSKYNNSEKLIYSAWTFGFPFAIYLSWKRRQSKAVTKPKTPHASNTPNTANQSPINRGNLDLQNNTQPPPKKFKIQRNLNPNAIECPVCGDQMVTRIAKRGRRRGNTFYGCINFPLCRGTSSITDAPQKSLEDQTNSI